MIDTISQIQPLVYYQTNIRSTLPHLLLTVVWRLKNQQLLPDTSIKVCLG